MGKIASATTVYARAYLTELGRQYLFNSESKPRYEINEDGSTIDRLKISRFSLGDPDVNYNFSALLESGDIPDLSGESEECITGAKGRRLNNLISPKEALFITEDSTTTVDYGSTYEKIEFNLTNSNATNSAAPVNQQLLFYINSILQNSLEVHGSFEMLSSNNGSLVTMDSDGIYRINLKTPTLSTNTTDGTGYRISIYPPSTSEIWDKAIIQIEKGVVSLQQST